MSEEEKAVRYIIFNAKKSEWPTWEPKYLARATTKGLDDIFSGEIKLRKKTEIEAETDESKMNEDEIATKMNARAYNDLMLSIDTTKHHGKTAFKIVKQCKNDEYPNGNAKQAWDKLKQKYSSTSVGTMLKLKEKFHSSKMKKSQDPSEWILELEELQDRLEEMNHAISDEDMMVHIISNLPKNYEFEKKFLRKKLKKEKLTLDEIVEELEQAYEESG